eukprot:15472592-Alexandrium_andersonii.AAC.1
MDGGANEPARPAGPSFGRQPMRLAVQRPRNDAPVNHPAVYHQPGERGVEGVLGGAAQPAAARSVVHNRPAVAGDSHARPRNGSVEQQLNGKRGGPGFGGLSAGAAVNTGGSRCRFAPSVAAPQPDDGASTASVIVLQRWPSAVEGDHHVRAAVTPGGNVRGILSEQL